MPCQSTERRHNQYATDLLDLRPDHRTSAACTDPVMQSPFSTLAASVGKRRITRSSSPTPAARSVPAVHRCRRSARHSSSDGRRGYRRYGRVSPAPRRPKRSSAMFRRSCQRSPGNALMRSGIAAGSRTGSNLFTAPSVQRRRGRHKGQGSGRFAGKRFTQDRVGYGKTVVFGVFERQGQVHAEIVPDCSRLTRLPQLGGHEGANPLIFCDRPPKGRHYKAPNGRDGSCAFRRRSAARVVAAGSCRVGAAVARAPCSAGCGAARRGAGGRWSAGGRPPSGWWRTSRGWCAG